jgi:hypothetical protein
MSITTWGLHQIRLRLQQLTSNGFGGCGKLPKDMKNASISKLKFKGSENPKKLNISALPSLLQHEKLKNKVQGINDFQF